MAMDADRERSKELYKSMKFGEKVAYIWRYYWMRIVGGAVLLCILIAFIGKFTWAKEKPRCLGIGVHSVYLDVNEIENTAGKLAEEHPEFTEEGAKEFKVYSFYNGTAASDGTDLLNILYKLTASIELKELDILVGDQDTLVADGQKQFLMDLRDLFTEEEFQAIEKAANQRSQDGESGIIYVSYNVVGDNGRIERVVENIPYLICISGEDAALDEVLLYQPEYYLAIAVNAQETDHVRSYIFSLLDLEEPNGH